MVSLALSSNQNDTTDSSQSVGNEVPSAPDGPDINPKLDEVELTEHPKSPAELETLPAPEPPSHEGISPTTEPSIILDE